MMNLNTIFLGALHPHQRLYRYHLGAKSQVSSFALLTYFLHIQLEGLVHCLLPTMILNHSLLFGVSTFMSSSKIGGWSKNANQHPQLGKERGFSAPQISLETAQPLKLTKYNPIIQARLFPKNN